MRELPSTAEFRKDSKGYELTDKFADKVNAVAGTLGDGVLILDLHLTAWNFLPGSSGRMRTTREPDPDKNPPQEWKEFLDNLDIQERAILMRTIGTIAYRREGCRKTPNPQTLGEFRDTELNQWTRNLTTTFLKRALRHEPAVE